MFRSAAADVAARYMAKDMHSGSRAEIERAIAELMTANLAERGFYIEGVLMKSITLPPGLYRAIEAKLAAEGERDAQEALAAALTPEVIEWNRIEAFPPMPRSSSPRVVSRR